MKDREIKSTIIILFLVSIFLFALIYFIHTKNIENRFDKALENYSLNIQTIMSNTTIDKTVITNESGNSITINNEFIINDEIANSFKSTFDINTRMLESSMAEIMKNSNDLLSFWFAFLSVIMIVFTFAGIFINNNILSESKEKLADVNNKANEIIENIKNQAAEETKKLIEKNSEVALNSIDKLKIEFNNSINLIQEKSNQMILDIKEQAQTESKQLIESIKDKAEEETKKLIEENNRNIKISNLFNSAYQAYDNKDYNSCINYYNQIIKITDNLLKGYDKNSEEYSKYKNNYLIAYNNIGNARNNLGLYEEAIKDFNKAIELNPNSSEVYYNIALSNTYLKHNEKAYNDFIKGYKLADDKLKDEYKQKIINLAKDDYEVAKKICNKMGWEY